MTDADEVRAYAFRSGSQWRGGIDRLDEEAPQRIWSCSHGHEAARRAQRCAGKRLRLAIKAIP